LASNSVTQQADWSVNLFTGPAGQNIANQGQVVVNSGFPYPLQHIWIVGTPTTPQSNYLVFADGSNNTRGRFFVDNALLGSQVLHIDTAAALNVDIPMKLATTNRASIIAGGAFQSAPVGTLLYCSDCKPDARCTAVGSGAVAKKLTAPLGVWVCN
jgi:hypothetical protein